nr:dynein regulatory complex subunit 6 isoform X2 [Jaculus jaculus]
MASLRDALPKLKNYFKDNYIPQVCEALLCGLLVTFPEDPLKYLEAMIMMIMEHGLERLIWDMCVHPSMKPKIRRLSETYLEQLFGLDDQLVTPELMVKACTFYTGNLVKNHFYSWKELTMPRANEEAVKAEKLEKAVTHDKFRCKRFYLLLWHNYVQQNKQRLKFTLFRIQKMFCVHRQKIILAKWRDIAKHRGKTREDDLMSKHELQLKKWKVKLKVKTTEETITPEKSSSDITIEEVPIEFDISELPERAIVQIFLYLSLRDTVTCGQVNRSWMSMIQRGSLWNSIDFSTVKNVSDKCVVSTLQKWRLNVLRLNFRGCVFRPKTLKAVGHCKNLQELNVSDCTSLTDESMRLISEGCPGILYLNLSNTTITNRTMRLLPRCFHNLQNLSLAYCRRFTDKGLQYLNLGKGCHKLIYLDLSGCTQVLVEKCPRITSVVFIGSPHISDCTFKALSTCNLRKIRFEGNKRITDACFKCIDKNYPNINHIYMADCKTLTDGSLKSLSPLKQLTVLNLANCVRIGDSGLKQFLDGPVSIKIRELNLSNCVLLGDTSIIKMSERCPNLHYLSLRNCEHLTDLGFEYIANILSLISVDLSGTVITNEGLTVLARHRKLRELSLSECSRITDNGIRAFCKASLFLEHLDVSYCPQLTDEILKVVAIYCTHVTSLSIAGCPKITDAGMEILSAKCHYLHILDISGCILLTDQMLQDLEMGCKQLRILKMQYCRGISAVAAHRMSSLVEQQEYSSDDPPPWFGYDSDGNPLLEDESEMQVNASKSTSRESNVNDENNKAPNLKQEKQQV